MNAIDLFDLRDHFTRRRILLCFNGPISHGLIEELGNALRNYLTAEQVQPSAVMDVFGVYIELTQNIRHYSKARGYDESDSAVTVVVAREDDGRYAVQAGNLVERADGVQLLERIQQLAAMDKVELKAAYKEQLRKPREEGALSGAGLGLIDVARKSSQPLAATLSDLGGERVFFSVRAVI
ncbi:MAG: biofilm regulation protein kinase SiaB [Pseudazoarcus pumilus]|nr:biofilm regulation protein kinase SiaB [Pseudazoarcus pumilus]